MLTSHNSYAPLAAYKHARWSTLDWTGLDWTGLGETASSGLDLIGQLIHESECSVPHPAPRHRFAAAASRTAAPLGASGGPPATHRFPVVQEGKLERVARRALALLVGDDLAGKQGGGVGFRGRGAGFGGEGDERRCSSTL